MVFRSIVDDGCKAYTEEGEGERAALFNALGALDHFEKCSIAVLDINWALVRVRPIGESPQVREGLGFVQSIQREASLDGIERILDIFLHPTELTCWVRKKGDDAGGCEVKTALNTTTIVDW